MCGNGRLNTDLNRLPASESPNINICNKYLESAKVGEKFQLKFKKGFFNEGWISDIVKLK